MSVKIKLDGKEYEVEDGALLIDVCHENGIDIPHFCYHPGLGPDGNCRMCQVEFVSERGNRIGISCKAVVMDGMEVLTQSEKALAARTAVEEYLLLNHPLDCPICDKAGECTLQDYYMAHDLQESRQTFTRFKKDKAVDLGPTLVLDQERCVLCDRCVRFLRDIAGDEQLFIAGRGHEAYITAFPGKEVDSPYSINTVDLCPVGALTAKDFRFAAPTWYLENTPSVCTTCARGCSMQIQAKDGRIHRMRPRHNPDVNGYWMCDEGRVNYKFVNDHRVKTPVVRRGEKRYEASYEEALDGLRISMGFPPGGKVADTKVPGLVVLASATCTLEEMYQLKQFARDVAGAEIGVVRHVPDGVTDELLRRSDKHPNTRGAELLGLDIADFTGQADPTAVDSIKSALGSNGVLLCVGFSTDIPAALESCADHAAKIIVLSGCQNSLTEKADLLIPGLTFAEKDGLVVNFEGHVQRLRAALDSPGVTEWKIIEDLTSSLRGTQPREFVTHIREEIMKGEPAFAGVDLTNVGATGVRVTGAPVS